MRTKPLLIGAGLVGLYAIYVISLQFFAYTSDAFIANDVVLVAPEVEGRIVAVHVTDSQFVRAGEPLITLDPTPYALEMDLKTAAMDKAKADHAAAERSVARVEADRSSAVAHLNFARVTERRFGDLAKQNAAPLQRYDEAVTVRLEAEAKLRAADAVLAETKAAATAMQAAVGVAEQALALARYQLEQTRVLAPIDGHVNNLWLRTGDYVHTGEARVGIVASNHWRVIALYKEEAIRHLDDGVPVWIYIDSYPYNLFRGRVQGIVTAIAHRDQQTALLPNIEPTTGWIRFQRRFPVRIELDADVPEQVKLRVGANARVLAVYGW